MMELRIPMTRGGWGYQKFSARAREWGIVGAVAVADGSRVALLNMAPTAVRAPTVEAAVLRGAGPAEAATEIATAGFRPPSDIHAGPEYRLHLARVLTARALQDASARRDVEG